MPSYFSGTQDTPSASRQRQTAPSRDRRNRFRTQRGRSPSPSADHHPHRRHDEYFPSNASYPAHSSVQVGRVRQQRSARTHRYDNDVSDLDLDRMDLDAPVARDRSPETHVYSPASFTSANNGRRRRRGSCDDDEEEERMKYSHRQVRPRVRSPVRPTGNYAAPSYLSDVSSDERPQERASSPATILKRGSMWPDEGQVTMARPETRRRERNAWHADSENSEDEDMRSYRHRRF